MISFMSNRINQRQKAFEREETVKKERIRREFENEIEDERLRLEI